MTEFLELMPDTVTLEAPTGLNAQGQPTYVGATVLPYRARIVGPSTALRMREQTEIGELYTLWITPATATTTVLTVTTGFRVTLPAAAPWNGRQPILFSINHVTDENGFHHDKITCGFMYHRQGQT